MSGANRGKSETPKTVLQLALTINAVMFGTEMIAGWLADSTALISDSLDMLADAAVYAVALLGAARGTTAQRRAAYFAGALQAVLAIGAAAEVIRRVLVGSEPEPSYMIGVSAIALLANIWCFRLIARHRHAGVHMTASWIFSQNDVIINAAVIVGGVLVAMTGFAVWDLFLGALIAFVVLSSAYRILRAAHESGANE